MATVRLWREARAAFKKWASDFRAWQQFNAEAHASVKSSGCCSHPPAGAAAKHFEVKAD
jgi:hypothetical protein